MRARGRFRGRDSKRREHDRACSNIIRHLFTHKKGRVRFSFLFVCSQWSLFFIRLDIVEPPLELTFYPFAADGCDV